ncbi:Isochorismatase-like protein [Limtongia smithiae]|uniref:Isochorismatase-like protein n=1 Tax=Limtongia smithiae TaxID=1125753 RepID=UPI0034CE536B
MLVRWWGVKGSIERYSSKWELMPELFSRLPSPPVLTPGADNGSMHFIRDKDRYDAFIHTSLQQILDDASISAVVITGTLTNMCCETTARTAFNRDFYVYFPEDANATDTAQHHAATIENLRLAFAQITTAEKVLQAVESLEKKA